jgi:hypothetical protein
MRCEKQSIKDNKNHTQKSLFCLFIYFFLEEGIAFTQLLMMNWRDLSFVVRVSEMDDFHYYYRFDSFRKGQKESIG